MLSKPDLQLRCNTPLNKVPVLKIDLAHESAAIEVKFSSPIIRNKKPGKLTNDDPYLVEGAKIHSPVQLVKPHRHYSCRELPSSARG